MKKVRILLIEDETDILALNARHLAAQGYEALTAKTLAEARSVVWETPPDLIVLDVQLPDGSGFDFCAEIRKITTAPIIYLTCMTGDDNEIKGLTSGGDDYITKPYSLDVLSARIMTMLRRSGFGAVGRIELPPLFIDLQLGRATLSGEELNLSPKELYLLAFFAGNAGRAFSSQELYETIWGDAGGTPVNTVKMHISNIRHKLKLDDSSAFELSLTPDKKYRFQKVSF